MYIGQEMKPGTVFHFIIDNTKYMVEEDLFQQCDEGDEIEFQIAPKAIPEFG